MDEQGKFFQSVRGAFGNSDSEEERKRRAREQALKSMGGDSSLQDKLSKYFEKRLKRG